MVRKLALALLVLFTPTGVWALGLGDIDLQSGLNQPLNAEIELLSVREGETEGMRVTLGSAEAFARASVDRPGLLAQLRFSVITKANGKHYVKVTTDQPIREPFLDFLVDVSWPNGQIVREYTLLLDPPVLMPAAPPKVQAPAAAQPRATAPAPAPRPAAAPAATTVAPAAYSGGDSYGPIQRNDTLWAIASRLRPDGSITVHQMMQALLQANPDAFINNNVNNLKAGAILRLPTREELDAISAAEALKATREQNTRWREKRAVAETAPAPEPAPAPVPAAEAKPEPGPAPATPAAPPPAKEAESQLKLVAPAADTPAEGAAAGPAGTASGEPGDMRQELALATEAVETQRQETEELRARLSDLEQQIATMQRLITLKDEQLAVMQQQAGEEPAAEAGEAGAAAGEGATAQAPTEAEAAAQPETPAAPATEAAAPESVPADAPAAKPEAGGVSGLLNNPGTLGVLVAVVLVLLTLAWLVVRRRQVATETLPEPMHAAPLRAEPAPVAERAAPVESTVERAVSGTPRMEEFEARRPEPQEADPLAEVDVFLAYGRYQQAEERIKDALRQEPERQDLRVKLLEVYHAARNRTAFEDEAAALHAALGGASGPLWERVVRMGEDLCPDHPLFAPQAPAPVREIPDVFEFETEDKSATTVGLPAEELPEFGEEEAGVEFVPPETETTAEFDTRAAELDEVGTKLDLAKAYIDMGDPDGARGILDEVMDEGNEEQKREARELLQHIS